MLKRTGPAVSSVGMSMAKICKADVDKLRRGIGCARRGGSGLTDRRRYGDSPVCLVADDLGDHYREAGRTISSRDKVDDSRVHGLLYADDQCALHVQRPGNVAARQIGLDLVRRKLILERMVFCQ